MSRKTEEEEDGMQTNLAHHAKGIFVILMTYSQSKLCQDKSEAMHERGLTHRQ